MRIKRKNIYKSCVALSVLPICIPSFVFAQGHTKSAITELKPIVIEGKKASVLDKVTVLTDRKTAQDLNKKQIDDIRDISRLNPSVAYNSNNDSFVIRGLDANRVLATIDGIHLPWTNDGVRGIKGGSSMFDLNALSTFDVVQGSDSSLYGSGALGGVVALRTLNPEDLIPEGKKWGGFVKGSYSSVDNNLRIDQALAVRTNQTFLLFQGSRAVGNQRENMGTIEGYGNARTRANPLNFNQDNLLFKINQYFDDNHKLSFTAERFNYDKDMHTLNASTSYYLPGSVYDKNNKRRERLSLSYNYDGNGDAVVDALHWQIYWQKQSKNNITNAYRVKAPLGDYSRDNILKDQNYGLNISGLKKVNKDNISHSLKFATHIFASQFHQYATGKDNCYLNLKENMAGCAFLHTNRSDAPDTNSRGFGLAFEDEIGFSNNRFRITPGIRYDWYAHIPQDTPSYKKFYYDKIVGSEKGQSLENSASRFSPKLRMEWNMRNQVVLYAQWAQAFRAPSVSELYLIYVNPTNYYAAGNPNLKPETSNGYDFGVKYGNANFGGSVSAFINQYKNFIDTIDKGSSREFRFSRQHYINRQNVRISGIEAKTHLKLSNGLHGHLSLAYAHGKDLDKDEYLNSIPAFKTIIGLGYAKATWGADVVLNLAAKRENVGKKSDYAKAPGYAVVDVLSWWKPLGENGLVIRAGVYNIFNQKYWNAVDLPSSAPRGASPQYKDYFSQPGRNFKISLMKKF
ncbi:TonB-dependent hemoglobin/transferrin/lactoferrin family receptor [Bartonella sp. A05]|uniref:TonB-dependent hemoglobin/transferrin/lactoferrin family receptor n=1 Tax=Bartonella sp. A05 TaxID=2967261 RepID=UPI0022A94D9C|nr:TonB-dependent hemoglobin/transferrin/lactoferrin family receptor [Bartonella sp. A05]MCZ2203826.1 TonB-dependent hemoglobin/transferrin/lactoferrin family receptor [Bartonella sp. A05]